MSVQIDRALDELAESARASGDKEGADQVPLMQFILSCTRTCTLVPTEKIAALLQEVDRFDSFGPFLDPTAWMRSRDTSLVWRRLIAAFLEFRREVDGVAEGTRR